MTIPSTPAKGKTLPDKPLPVRFIQVLDRDLELEGRFQATMAYVDGEFLAKHGWHLQPQHTYTLLPPHLADEWRRLKEAKAKAEETLLESSSGHRDYPDCSVVDDDALSAWQNAINALDAFEQQHGIGGGA